MRNQKEYIVCKQIAQYLRLQYPKVIFHFDLAGLNLSRAQAGMMKAIQGGRGYPDLFIIESRNGKYGLFLELKSDETKLINKKNLPATSHISEQADFILAIERKGYAANFAVGFDDAKRKIDEYLTGK
jgi:hypothetical protein